MYSKQCLYDLAKNVNELCERPPPKKKLYEQQYCLYLFPNYERQGCRMAEQHVTWCFGVMRTKAIIKRPGHFYHSATFYSTFQHRKGGNAALPRKPKPLGLQFLSFTNLSTKNPHWPESAYTQKSVQRSSQPDLASERCQKNSDI